MSNDKSMPSTLKAILFPMQPRSFYGQRWVNIGMRCVHLVGITGIGGGFLNGLDAGSWSLYWQLTVFSGVALSLIYIWSSGIWLLELKGLAIILKLVVLTVALMIPDLRSTAFILVIIMSGLIAHAPARVRSWRWLDISTP
jgi:hypothetical protein